MVPHHKYHKTGLTQLKFGNELCQFHSLQTKVHLVINSSVMAQVGYALYSMDSRVCKDEGCISELPQDCLTQKSHRSRSYFDSVLGTSMESVFSVHRAGLLVCCTRHSLIHKVTAWQEMWVTS